MDLVEHRGQVLDEEVRIRLEAQLTEPAPATGAGLGGGKVDRGTSMADLNRPGVLCIMRRAYPARRSDIPLVEAGRVSASEHGRDSVVPQALVGG